MKNLLVIASLFFSLNLWSQDQCGQSLQGVGDAFPWGLAQPFPWTKIQGLWKIDGNTDLVLKLKVIRQTSSLKQLDVQIYSKSESCMEPKMKGVGLLTSLEKNVVRIIVENKLIKLAVFNSIDLEMNPSLCGQQIMGISMVDLGVDFDSALGSSSSPQSPAKNMVLKKITPSLDLFCKKH